MKRRIIACCQRLGTDTGASEIAEAALVLPLVFLFLLAIITFGRAYNIYTTIAYAAHEGARTAVTPTCALCGNTPALAAAVATTVTQALQASKINPGQIQVYDGTSTGLGCGGAAVTCSNSSNVHVCTNVQLNATGAGPTVTGPTACGATVSFQYPYQLNLPFTSVNKQIVTLKADVQMEQEN